MTKSNQSPSTVPVPAVIIKTRLIARTVARITERLGSRNYWTDTCTDFDADADYIVDASAAIYDQVMSTHGQWSKFDFDALCDGAAAIITQNIHRRVDSTAGEVAAFALAAGRIK